MQDYSIIKEKAFQEIEKALSSSELVDLRVKYLGKTGEISLLMKNMKDIAPEERASFGKIVNELKTEVETKIQQKDADLVGNMISEGTTPRRLTDLIGSLCDLTSGSGDKGTPIVFIQGYFDNYTTD